MTVHTWFEKALGERGAMYSATRDDLVAAGPQAAHYLKDRAADPDPEVSRTAETLLAWIRHRELFNRVTVILRVCAEADRRAIPALVSEELARLGPDVVPRLLEALTRTEEAGAPVILQALARLRDPRAVEPLLRLLRESGDGMTRALVLSTLGAIGGRDVRESAAALVADGAEDTIVRSAAAICLARTGEGQDAAALEAAARSPEPMLRASAYRALGTLADEAGERILVQAKEDDELTALELVGALSQLARRPALFESGPASGDSPAIQALQEAANHPNPAVRRAAKEAIP